MNPVAMLSSQKTADGLSLNSQLAMDQPDLTDHLLRFRIYQFAFTADIEKMYRQILVDESQTDLQHIIWRESKRGSFAG